MRCNYSPYFLLWSFTFVWKYNSQSQQGVKGYPQLRLLVVALHWYVCVLSNSLRNFDTQYHKDPLSRPTIYSWHKNFVETGCSVCHAKSPGHPCVSDTTVEQLRESFIQSSQKSIQRASQETSSHWIISIPGKTGCVSLHMTVQNTVHPLGINLYKLSKL
jgi:hypothetical protein